MGKVNVVLRDGSVISVTEEEAAKLRPSDYQNEAPLAAGERQAASFNEANTSGVRAAVEGGLDALTLGGYGALNKELSGGGERMVATAKTHPGARLAGEIAASLAPYGALGKVGKAATALTGLGAAARVGEVGGTVARLGEGAIIGLGARIAESNVSADPLSVEGLVEGAGFSALLNAGLSGIAGRLFSGGEATKAADVAFGDTLEATSVTSRGATPRADAARAAEKTAAARRALTETGDAEALSAAKQTLEESPAYANVRAAYESVQQQAKEFNAGIARETKAYEAATTSKKLTAHLEVLETQQQEARAALQKEARAKEEAALLEGDLPLGETPGDVIPAESDAELGDFGTTQKRLTKLTRAINSVRKDLKAGFMDHAADTLRGHFPEIPALPGDLKSVGPDLPKSLFDLGRSKPETIAAIAQHSDGAVKGELDKLAQEVGYDTGETAADTLSTLNTRIRQDYVLPSSRVVSKMGAAEEAVTKAKWGELSSAVDARRAGQTTLEDTAIVSGQAKDASKAELDKLADEMGLSDHRVERAPTQTADGVLTEGGGYREWRADAVSRGAAAGSEGASSIFDNPLKWARNGARAAAGRLADVGGWKGAVLRTVAGSAAGYAIDGTTGALTGGALVNGKMAARSKIGEALARFGRPVADAASKLGPVTAAMYSHFPGGQRDSEKDQGQLAVNRINEVHAAAYAAPDAMFSALRGFMGDPGDVAFKLRQKLVGGLEYLSQTAPKDPGINVSASGSDWAPSFRQIDDWFHRFEGVTNPMGYIARVLSGDGSPTGVEALAYQWGGLLDEARLAASQKDWSDLSLEEQRGLSMLFQQPISGLQHPDVVMTIQGNYLPKPETAGPTAGGKPGFGSNPTGRPPAVSSSIAGSSVLNLTQ